MASRLRTKYISCPRCGGGLPGEVPDDLVCKCGSGADEGQGEVDWTHLSQMLMLRSGSRCEIQSPACLGGLHGDLREVPSGDRSIHHRRPRGMGGTKRIDVHTLAGLINTCGHGSKGCHWYAETQRTWAFDRGLLLPKVGVNEVSNPAVVPLVLPGGRRVLLDPDGPYYNSVTDGVPYAL